MHIKISKGDVLQSIGFASTNAVEEYERIRQGIIEVMQLALEQGSTVEPDMQADMSRALTAAKQRRDDIDRLRRMAEFANDREDILLDCDSFALLEHNLPAR